MITYKLIAKLPIKVYDRHTGALLKTIATEATITAHKSTPLNTPPALHRTEYGLLYHDQVSYTDWEW